MPFPVEPFATANAGYRVIRFVYDSTHVNAEIQALENELEGLEKTAATAADVLGERELHAFQGADISTNASELLKLCKTAVHEFKLKTRSLKPSRGGKWTPADLLRQARIMSMMESISRMRAQIHTHSVNLNTVIGLFGLIVSATTAPQILEVVMPQVELSHRLLQTNLERLPSTTEKEKNLKRQSILLSLETEETLARAKVGSTPLPAQQPFIRNDAVQDIQNISQQHVSVTSTIETQEIDTKELINEPPAAADDLPSPIELPTRMYARHSQIGLWTSGVENFAPRRNSIAPYSSDFEAEFESQLMRNSFKEAELAFSREDYNGAEKICRAILNNTSALYQTSMPNAQRHAKVNLTIALFRQGRLDDAIRETSWLEFHTIREDDDDDRNLVFECYHTLAQLQLVKGDSLKASRVSGKSISHFSWMKEQGHLQARWHHAVALHITIYSRLGNEAVGRIFAPFLPEDFIRPDFHRSHVWLPQIGEAPSTSQQHADLNDESELVQVHEIEATASNSDTTQPASTESQLDDGNRTAIPISSSALPLSDDLTSSTSLEVDTTAVPDDSIFLQSGTPDDSSLVFLTAKTHQFSGNSYFGLSADRDGKEGLGIDLTGGTATRDEYIHSQPSVLGHVNLNEIIPPALPTVYKFHDVSLRKNHQVIPSTPDQMQIQFPESVPSLSPAGSSVYSSFRGSWGSVNTPVMPTSAESSPDIAELPNTLHADTTVLEFHSAESNPRGRHHRSNAQSAFPVSNELRVPFETHKFWHPPLSSTPKHRKRRSRSLEPTPRSPMSPLSAEFERRIEDKQSTLPPSLSENDGIVRHVSHRERRQGVVFTRVNRDEREQQVS